MAPDANDPNLDNPLKIELGEIPQQLPRRARVAHTTMAPLELAPTAGLATPEEEPENASWQSVKKTVKRGFFDPFEAFEQKVDRERFWRTQGFLILTSLLGPLLATLVLGLFAALVYQLVAAIGGFTPPNAFYELALYPVVYILAKGYWICYLLLPLAVLLVGWLWAAGTAWNLARDAGGEDFGKMFCILALLGSMYAPFIMFPFIRLVVLGFLIWFVSQRMTDYFAVPFFHLVRRGGVLLLLLAAGYTWIERKMENYYPLNAQLSTNLNAIYNSGKKLEWPAFRAPKQVSAAQVILENLASMDQGVRDKATRAGQAVLTRVTETPDDRFKVGLRLAEMGNTDGMVYVARAYQSGQGVTPDAAQSLAWMGKAVENNPKNLEYAMNLAALYIQNKRALEGKHLFVQLAKRNLGDLNKIAAFTKICGFGAPDTGLTSDIQSLYKMEATPYLANPGLNQVRNQIWVNGRGYSDPIAFRQDLLARLANQDKDPNQWFYRALITEFGGAAVADPEVYGEKAVDLSTDEALKDIPQNDPVALAKVGDQFNDKGNAVRAREFWLKATLALDSDVRRPNASLYLKLAESCDPPGKPAEALPKEAIRYYLGYVLLGDSHSNVYRNAIEALRRLGVAIDQNVDISSPAFFALCAKHDQIEGLVKLGCENMGGRNQAKARECFQKAKELGYQGPAIHMLDGSK